jgi:hypothetical protein
LGHTIRSLLDNGGRGYIIACSPYRHADETVWQEITDHVSRATACGAKVGKVQVATGADGNTGVYVREEASDWCGRGRRIQVCMRIGRFNAENQILPL